GSTSREWKRSATVTRSSPSSTRRRGAASTRGSRSSRTASSMSFASVSGERESLYHVPAGRGPEQRRYMEDLEAAGICVFCPDHFATYHREPIEIEGRHWYVTKNDYPY